MAWPGIKIANTTYLKEMPSRDRILIDQEAKEESMNGQHHEDVKLHKSNMCLITTILIKLGSMEDVLEKIQAKVERLEERLNESKEEPSIKELADQMGKIKLTDAKLDELKRAVNNIGQSSGALPQPNFNWRQKKIPELEELLKKV